MTTDLEALADTVPEFNSVGFDQRRQDRINRFAARLARHGDIRLAAVQCGLSATDGAILFKRVCDDLGSQAR